MVVCSFDPAELKAAQLTEGRLTARRMRDRLAHAGRPEASLFADLFRMFEREVRRRRRANVVSGFQVRGIA